MNVDSTFLQSSQTTAPRSTRRTGNREPWANVAQTLLSVAPSRSRPLLRVATFNHAESRHRQECLCHIDPSISRGGRNVLRRPARSKQNPDRRRGWRRGRPSRMYPVQNVAPRRGGRAARRADSSISLLTVVPSLAARSLRSSRSSSSIAIVVRT